MKDKRKYEIALLAFFIKLKEEKVGELMEYTLTIGNIAKQISEDPRDLCYFWSNLFYKVADEVFHLKVYPVSGINRETAGRIAYKLLCLHIQTENVSLTKGLRRQIGSEAKMIGISTDEEMEFMRELVNDAFFSHADLNGGPKGP